MVGPDGVIQGEILGRTGLTSSLEQLHGRLSELQLVARRSGARSQ